jgi:hypothetical protein
MSGYNRRTGGVEHFDVAAQGDCAVLLARLLQAGSGPGQRVDECPGRRVWLYTTHIPASSPMKPVVNRFARRPGRASRTLVAERCGQYSRVLLGVDGGSGYLYAVGHANGGLWCCICGGSASSTSTDRPNPVGMHRITVVAVDGLRLQVNNLEALDGTPIVDVKPVLGGIPER